MLFNKRPNTIAHIDLPMLIIAVIKGSKVLGKMTCIIKEETEGITISDIICKRNNKGYGSLMMNKLVEVAREEEYKYIDGWLSKEDANHVNRLYHFYRKFGFEIISHDEGMKFADIRLIL